LSLAMLALVLAGCGHVPVMSMVALARINVATTDPAQLRAAIKLPRAIKPQPQGMTLRIGVRLASGHEEAQDFMLREVSEPNDVLPLLKELDPSTHIFAYRLDPAAVATFAAFRDSLQKKQAATAGRGGSITISIRPEACRTGNLPERAIYITTYLQTAETGGYVPLMRDLDLRTIDPGRDLAAQIPPCG
jgi:hypothetical protein